MVRETAKKIAKKLKDLKKALEPKAPGQLSLF